MCREGVLRNEERMKVNIVYVLGVDILFCSRLAVRL